MTTTLLNSKEAAEYLRLTVGYLAKLRCTGDGPAFIKFGAKVLYKEDDLSAYIENNVHKNTSDQTTENSVPNNNNGGDQ